MEWLSNLGKYSLSAVISSLIGFWPLWYLRKKKPLNEEELEKISHKFKGVASFYNRFQLWGSLPIFIVSSFLIIATLNHYVLKGGRIIVPPFVFFFAMGLSLGIFALLKGVYPTTKKALFYYDEGSTVRNVALLQVLFSIISVIGLIAIAYIW